MACKPDKVELRPIGEVLKELKKSKILVVGRDGGPTGKAIYNQFGVEVIAVKFPELHQAWLNARPEAAQQFR